MIRVQEQQIAVRKQNDRISFQAALWSYVLLLSCSLCRGEEKEFECGVYLAPSSIAGAGLGMYAGDTNYAIGDRVTFGDTVIPITDYDWNNEGGPFENDKFLWDEYTWNGPVFPGMDEEGEDADLVMGASPGVGAAANSYLTLVNLEDSYTKIGRAVAADSPGIGASSIFYGREFHAKKPIPIGGEIWADYGPSYFKGRTWIYGYLPLPDTFKKTDKLLDKYLRIKMETKSRGSSRLLEEDQTGNDFWSHYYEVMKSFGTIWKTSRILNGLPDEEERIAALMAAGGGGSGQKDYERSIRDIAWLKENGQCMDNIKVGNSTNPDAGRGAFANRFIPEGGLVAPAPLIHIGNYNALKVFRGKNSEDGSVVPDRDGPYSFQLLMNYCFGHEESTLLLCPYGLLTAFINHSHENPNTRIQWSKEMRHADWREQSMDAWVNEYHTGLQIDFVSLRDIEPDEEILIDYGAAWEAAWQEHTQRFVPRKNYIPAFELNEMVDIDYRTAEEDDYEVNDVRLMCADWYIQQFIPRFDGDCECRVLKKLGYTSSSTGSTSSRYLVQLRRIYDYEDKGYTSVLPGNILWNVPADALYFVDMPYTRDHYDFQAFRHSMGIPDDMFPEVWKTSMK